VVAPAMNVNMFDHPAVRENLDVLRARGVRIVDPGSGYLACGWLGRGRLAEPADIVEATMAVLSEIGASGTPAPVSEGGGPGEGGDLAGETVLVTAGPTVEDLDPVRFLSNRSTGRMGFALAEAARDRGARVILVAGPTSVPPPDGVDLVSVRSADEMARAVADRVGPATMVAMAAAVSDYRPAQRSPNKMKKGTGDSTLPLTRTTDILATLGKVKGQRFVIGFAAETDRVLENARGKRAAKNADLLVANDITRAGSGFASDHNAAVLIDAEAETELPLMSKRALADRIWDRALALRSRRRTPVLAKRAARPARRR
jgi:phosphopantothenoylcysteine decarboxylase/phosphopantothenate--cysteine ligase